MKIKSGTSKMKVNAQGFQGWHKFATDAEYTCAYKYGRTVLIVKSGPDKGTYVQSL